MLSSGRYDCSGLRRRHRPLACITAAVRVGVFVGILALPSGSNADFVTVLDASLVTQSMADDLDYFFLNQIEGLTAQTTYTSTPGGEGWTGSLTGGGANINYNGDTSQYKPTTYGSITWSSTGSFNSDTWSSTGTTTFTPTAVGAQFTISDRVTVAGADETGCITLDGLLYSIGDDLDIFDQDTSGSGRIRGAKITVVWPKGFDYSVNFSFNPMSLSGSYDSYLTVPFLPSSLSFLADSGTYNAISGALIVLVAPRSVSLPVPEPSGVVLFALGTAGLIFYRRRRSPRCTAACIRGQGHA
jgi:PEP-CTERM motif